MVCVFLCNILYLRLHPKLLEHVMGHVSLGWDLHVVPKKLTFY